MLPIQQHFLLTHHCEGKKNKKYGNYPRVAVSLGDSSTGKVTLVQISLPIMAKKTVFFYLQSNGKSTCY